MAKKTTTTTKTLFNIDTNGIAVPYYREVTETVEHDDDGNPYGPVPAYPAPFWPRSPYTVTSYNSSASVEDFLKKVADVL